MSDFDPGEGWREVQYGYELEGHEQILWNSTGDVSGTARMWVRVEPVPPLPTEVRTSVKVTYTAVQQEERERTVEDWVLLDNGLQWMSDGCEFRIADELRSWITGFKVLARPMPDYDADDEFAARVRREERQRIFDELQPQLLKDPYADWEGVMSKKQQRYGKGFVSGHADALNMVARATRDVSG